MRSGLVICALLAASPLLASDTDPIRFNRDIRPILAENCFRCHGPDPSSRKAGLRFDREDLLFGRVDDGAVVVRGKPDESLLYQRITSDDPEEAMPPKAQHQRPSVAQIAAIKRWIEQGAPWEPHWSFIKPERPAQPKVGVPSWIRNPIDAFVLARLEKEGLQPAPEADRRTLARRLSLDLTGLPPEPALVDAFEADTETDAYGKLVDRLMATPQYGEHRAHYWLDVVRYADTNGLSFDNMRSIWPYRDWVVQAFNSDMPFDQFTIEQLAGDLLPKPTTEQLIATGLQRCNPTTNENGTFDDEALAIYARDRVETTSWVFLGLTANCAVCHDHKFDPIPTREFYAMSAFFRNTTQKGLDHNQSAQSPALTVPQLQDIVRWTQLKDEVAAAKKELAAAQAKLRKRYDAILNRLTVDDCNGAIRRIGEPALHLPLNGDFDGTIAGVPFTAKTAAPIAWQRDEAFGEVGEITEQIALTIPGQVGDFERDQPYTISCWVNLPKDFVGSAALLAKLDDGDDFRGWDLFVDGDEFVAHLSHHWSDDALSVRTSSHIVKPGTWQHVAVTYDGTSSATGLQIYIDGIRYSSETEADCLRGSTRTETPLRVGRRKDQQLLKSGSLRDIRLYERALSVAEIKRLAAWQRSLAILAKPPSARAKEDNDFLFSVISSDDPELKDAQAKTSALNKEWNDIKRRSGQTLIQQEREGVSPSAQVLKLGQYDQPLETVGPGVFGALNPYPQDAPKNRLGLARWLVSPDNPLTARVIANRTWQEFFGTGLVKTAEDFGIMGEAPSHPELLDLLAVELRDGGWDLKKLVRLIVTSNAYRQASILSDEKLEKDPGNRLLSRGPRFRMDAEMVRDYALSAAGILSPTIGGAGIKPYQPAQVWETVAKAQSNTRTYAQDTGDKLYRRSLYVFWKRQAPLPALELFDAPKREVSCLRRDRTNTPLQALVTLNDTQFVEAARMLAQKALLAGNDDSMRIELIAQRVLSRTFSAEENAIVRRDLEKFRAHYRSRVDDARALCAVGDMKADKSLDPSELAAFAMLCSEILNLDETLNK